MNRTEVSLATPAWLLCGLACLVACGPETSSVGSPRRVEVPGMLPTLVEIPISLPEDAQPSTPLLAIGLTARGTVTFRPGGRTDRIMATVDSTGAVIAEWGRRGEGPGEMHGGELILSGDSLIALADGDGNPVMVYTPGGRLVRQRARPPSGLPSAFEGGAVYWWRSFSRAPTADNPSPSGRLEPLERWCVDHECRDVILETDDLSLLTVYQSPPTNDGAYPAFAVDGTRLVLGDGFSYTLWMHDIGSATPPVQFGRSISPRMSTEAEIARQESIWTKSERAGTPGPGGQRIRPDFTNQRRELRERPRLHFQYMGFGFDGKGRLWVMGRANDSTFLDVFADTTFLGRMMVDCRRSGHASTVRGHWLALGCRDDEDISQPYRIRLFRIEEP